MLPPQLVGIYQQYKQDTDSVAAWLASTAKSCGYPADLLTPKTQQAEGSAQATAASTPTPYVVAVSDYIPLATCIARYKNGSFKVPDTFSRTIDRVIALRSEFARKLREQPVPKNLESDQTHGHFVEVLKAVRDVLYPCMSSRAAPKATKEAAAQTALPDMTNKFATLSVDEPSEAFLKNFQGPLAERPRPQKYDKVTYRAQICCAFDDSLFSLSLLMKDLYALRKQIMFIWSDYESGNVDLAAAAVASNTAVAVARGMIEDAAIPEGQRLATILLYYYLGQCGLNGYDLTKIDPVGMCFEEDLYDLANKACYFALDLLNYFIKLYDPKFISVFSRRMNGPCTEVGESELRPLLKKYQEDRDLLLEIFTEFSIAFMMAPSFPIQDEFFHSLKSTAETRTVTMSLVFATQVFLDIRHTMKSATRKCFVSVMNEANMMQAHLNKCLGFHQKFGIKINVECSDKALFEKAESLTAIMERDIFYDFKVGSMKQEWVTPGEKMEPYVFFIRSPILAGIYIFILRTEMYRIGSYLSRCSGSILSCAHLYNCLDQEGLLKGRWRDMDMAIAVLGEKTFMFGGKKPSNPSSYFERYCIQTGVEAASFAKNRRRPEISSRGRRVKLGAPVSFMFLDTVRGKRINARCLVNDMHAMLSQYKDIVSTGDRTSGIQRTETPQDPKDKHRSHQKKRTKKKSKEKKDDGMTPEELIVTTLFALQTEKPELTFPFTILHRFCWTVLKNVKRHCEKRFDQVLGPMSVAEQRQLPTMVGHIFAIASGFESKEMDMSILELTALPVNQMIDSGSGTIATVVFEEMGYEIEETIEGNGRTGWNVRQVRGKEGGGIA